LREEISGSILEMEEYEESDSRILQGFGITNYSQEEIFFDLHSILCLLNIFRGVKEEVMF
jgi:hypothetical protein